MKRITVLKPFALSILTIALLLCGTNVFSQNHSVDERDAYFIAAAGEMPFGAPQEEPNETLKTVQIMSRVLNEILLEQFGDDYKSQGYFYDGCRGLWIPGHGVQFLLSVDFPVHYKKEESKESKVSEEKKDLWDQYEEKMMTNNSSTEAMWDREISGYVDATFTYTIPDDATRVISTSRVVRSRRSNPTEFMKLERLKETILGVVAKYGHRIAGLRSDEEIVIVINGTNPYTGGDPSRFWNRAPRTSIRGSSGVAYGSSFFYSGDDSASTLILQIPYRELPREGGDAEAIEEAVKTTSYATYASLIAPHGPFQIRTVPSQVQPSGSGVNIQR